MVNEADRLLLRRPPFAGARFKVTDCDLEDSVVIPFKVTDCDLKTSASSWVNSNMKSAGKRSMFLRIACIKTLVSTS